ncbi:MAG: nuclear transport factor 2 family protein [Thermoleophilia bacterium]|nr:nuclear transport factor 2 family protein [Thermoleophilia bacterium]
MHESTAVRDALLGFYAAFTANDPDRFDREILARVDDAMMIGTAPHEFHVGREKIVREFGMEGVGLRAGGALRAWEDGSVGWAADTPVFTLPGGPELETRMTSVWRREDGRWKLVQAHFSVGIADEEAAGHE